MICKKKIAFVISTIFVTYFPNISFAELGFSVDKDFINNSSKPWIISLNTSLGEVQIKGKGSFPYTLHPGEHLKVTYTSNWGWNLAGNLVVTDYKGAQASCQFVWSNTDNTNWGECNINLSFAQFDTPYAGDVTFHKQTIFGF